MKLRVDCPCCLAELELALTGAAHWATVRSHGAAQVVELRGAHELDGARVELVGEALVRMVDGRPAAGLVAGIRVEPLAFRDDDNRFKPRGAWGAVP